MIGKIAASHNWPIEDILSKLPRQVSAPGQYPKDWRVDPVKIACLLRCADAAHIDNRRAPEFLYALTRRSGISLDHWKAQIWLGQVDIDQSDGTGTSILFTSNRDFGPDDVDAWWVAYDAVQLVHKEIRSANQLLVERGSTSSAPSFHIKRVTGISSPEALAEYIRVDGWKPCSAQVHVGNIENLVRDLGGSNLYGNDHHLDVALRELIQNARDAIVARQAMEAGFTGHITVRVRITDDAKKIIEVEDNGIGMSERVLTDALLDFGNSFWASNLVQQEFPGLRSSNFKAAGRYGIGFFSVFMVAKSVTVSTRRWDAGLDEVRTLTFSNGLTLRPVLAVGQVPEFGSSSTKVTISLQNEYSDLGTFKIRSGRIGQSDIEIQFNDFLAALTPGLDVKIILVNEKGDTEIIHEPIHSINNENDRLRWLRKQTFIDYINNPEHEKKLIKIAKRLRFISDERNCYGLAALSTILRDNTWRFGINTVGGLATNAQGRGNSAFYGYFDCSPNSAKRDATNIRLAPLHLMEEWKAEQLKLIAEEEIDPLEWYVVTSSLASLGLDPLPILRAPIMYSNRLFIADVKSLYTFLSTRGIAMFMSNIIDHIDTYHNEVQFENYPTFRPLANSNLLSLKRTGNIPEHEHSFLGCIYRIAKKNGKSLRLTTHHTDKTTMLNQPLQALVANLADEED